MYLEGVCTFDLVRSSLNIFRVGNEKRMYIYGVFSVRSIYTDEIEATRHLSQILPIIHTW